MSMQQMLLASASTSLKVGLLDWWELDEASGDRLDSIGGRSMVPTGTVTQVAAVVGDGVQTAAGAYLKTANSPNLATGEFTVAGVFKTSNADMGVIGRNGTPVGTGRQWIMLVEAGVFYLVASTDGTSSTHVVTGPSSINDGNFHDYIAWRDPTANTINLEFDGGSVISTALTGSTPLFSGSDPGITLSGVGTDVAYLTGGVHDAVGIWGRMLSSTERAFLRNGGAWRSFAAL